MEHMTQSQKRGYYTVNIEAQGRKIPYVVFAASDFHAARLVRHETGYAASESDVEGPYKRG